MSTTTPSLAAALELVRSSFGEEALIRLGSTEAREIDTLSTGALTLDMALGIGGVPRGRLVEVFGPESSGKTTLVYHILANAQAAGGTCAFIDAEHALDPHYAAEVGVDTENLLVCQPDYGEQALQIADTLVASGEVAVVAIDSVDAITPRVILDGEMGEATVGALPRLMSQACRKLAPNAARTNTLVLFTNQIREKIGTLGYGSPETQPGGRALKFYASQRIDLRRIATNKQGEQAIGNRVKAKVVKNKLAAPHRTAEFDIDYGRGISAEGCLLDEGIKAGLITKKGAWFAYGDEQIGQGRPRAKAFLMEHPEHAESLRDAILASLGGQDA